MENREKVLEVSGLGIDFGGLTAVNDLDLTIYQGEIYGLIGPNGAGKTTVFNMLTKVYQPTRGTIRLCGQDMAKMNPVTANIAGVARTFQNIRLFDKLSVLDNVKVGMHNSIHYRLFSALLRLPSFYSAEKEADQNAMNLLSILGLDQYADTEAGNLPYGAQRRLEIARALATEPKLLLLDEPAAILLIEHDMKLVMGICERITVLNFGQLLAQGIPSEIQSNKEVIKAYIGE